MATYDLKYPGAAIDAILDTAYHLQQAGYIFRGSASDYSGTLTEREWVIAPAGFSGLGLSSAVPKGSIGICLYNGTSWTGKIINVLTLDSQPTRNSQNGVTSGGVAATLDEIAGGIMATFASLLFDDETAAADLRTKLSYAVKFSVSDFYQTVTHLNILAATASKAGLLSAADKAKLDALWSSGYQFAGIATPSTTPISTTSKIFYIATEAGTYFNAVTVTQGINILSWNGSTWSAVQVVGIDDEPTAGSDNMVKSGGVQNELALGAVYDVSTKNPTAGPNNDGKWESLSALLSDANLNTLIPTAYRKGGMSIKFVQTSDNNYVQYRLIADEFTTDVAKWAIADEGVYVENPEYIYVKTDGEDKILWAIKTDGSIYYGAGCPQQVKDYIEEKISSLSLDEYEDIVAFLSDYLGSDTTLKTLLDSKLDAEGLDKDALETQSVINNPEWIHVKTDSEDKVLEGIKTDGTKFENLPIKFKDKVSIDGVIIESIQDPEGRTEIKTDAEGNILSYRDNKGVIHEEVGIETPFVKITGDRFDILSLFPPEKIVPLLKNFKFISHESAGNWNDFNGNRVTKQPYYPLTLLHFSDIHEDYYNLSRISKFYHTYKDYIDDVVFTGDFVLNTFNPSKTTPLWNNCDAKDFLYVLGNHDACSNLSPFTPVSPKQEYDNYIEPYLDKTNIIAVENHCYWHKDYTEAISPECSGGVRFIAIDQYHWYERDIIGEYVNPVYADGTTVDTGQQETWLRGLLDDALSNGYAVITALHSPVNCDAVVDVDSSFNAIDKIPTAQYSQIPIAMLNDIQDFIDAGGEFICWMAGHMHQDWFVQIKDYTDQLLMVMDTGSSNMMDRDNYLMYNTPYTDKFNIVSIEPVKKYIRLYRIGMTFDRHGRHVGSMVYDYKNKKVIYNS